MKNIIIAISLSVTLFGCKNKNHVGHRITESPGKYTCPMPKDSVFSNKPGTCPKCGMKLIEVEANFTHNHQAEMGNMDILLKPTDEFAISTIPLTTLKKNNPDIVIKSLGNVNYDNKFVGSIAARVMGRVDKLYVKFKFQKIYKGQKLLDIYSPELLTEQKNFLYVLMSDSNNLSMVEAVKQRLSLLGLSSSEIQKLVTTHKINPLISIYANYDGQLQDAGSIMPSTDVSSSKSMSYSNSISNDIELRIKEGSYLQKGQTIFSIYNQSCTYALLNIFNTDQSLVKKGQVVEITPEANPDNKVYGKIDFIEPFYRKESKTLNVRVYFDNQVLKLPIGSQIKATVMINPKLTKWLPKSAVLSMGIEKIVLKKYGNGLVPIKIKTGIQYNNQIEILEGLTQSDSVATNAQFLMDSESFIKIKKIK